MITSTHDQLEAWVAAITLIGVGLSGWTAFLQTQKNRLDEKIDENKKMQQELRNESHSVWEKQWQRIDELRENAAKFITRDHHEQSIKDIYSAIKEAIRPLSDKIDRLIESRNDR